MRCIIEVIISLTILLISVSSCSYKKDNTYQDGLRSCREKVAQYQIKHPNTPALSAREDIIGYKIPELNTQTINGQKIDQKYFKGKFGIINFWFEGCPPCVKEIPDLNEMADKFGNDNLYYLAIGRDTKEDILLFLQDHPWKFDQIVNGTEVLDGIFENIWGYPTTLIVDRNGVIVYAVGGIYEKNKPEVFGMIESLIN
ncbi:MAG TPA: TlpA disulfide reductase family protein [Saprospiraceae bacterium]|nr:TlpA disulfide reductase family protein [Saprospiraceae bacterium]